MLCFRAPWLALASIAAATPAFADPASGEACSKTLQPPALMIYRAASPEMRADTDMESLLRRKTMPLVIMGDMNQSTARPAAIAASTCLRELAESPHKSRVVTISSTK
jgi:hypothetical protein